MLGSTEIYALLRDYYLIIPPKKTSARRDLEDKHNRQLRRIIQDKLVAGKDYILVNTRYKMTQKQAKLFILTNPQIQKYFLAEMYAPVQQAQVDAYFEKEDAKLNEAHRNKHIAYLQQISDNTPNSISGYVDYLLSGERIQGVLTQLMPDGSNTATVSRKSLETAIRQMYDRDEIVRDMHALLDRLIVDAGYTRRNTPDSPEEVLRSYLRDSVVDDRETQREVATLESLVDIDRFTDAYNARQDKVNPEDDMYPYLDGYSRLDYQLRRPTIYFRKS